MIDLSDLNNLTFDPKLKGKMAVQLVASHGLQLHRHDFVGLVEASIGHCDLGWGIQFGTIHQDVLVCSKSEKNKFIFFDHDKNERQGIEFRLETNPILQMVKNGPYNEKGHFLAISKNHYSITLWWFLECVSDSDSPRPESESFFLIGLRPIKSWWCPTEWSPTEQSEWLDDLPSFSLALNKWVINMSQNVIITNISLWQSKRNPNISV